jgi:hypothetical protein
MKADLALSKEMTDLLGSFCVCARAALAAVPPLPGASDLASFTFSGDLLGGDVTITVAPAPALLAWIADVKTRLAAFTQVS